MKITRILWRASLLSVLFNLAFINPAQAQSIGDSMVGYLSSKVGSRVGGGEASHLATEALRVGGGEFYPGDLGSDFPGDGDKVWGSLVKVISNANGTWTDSSPDVACLPGDVLQFGGNAVVGATTYPSSFTAVANTVSNANNRPTSVFQQNFGGNRTVQTASIDLKQLSSGWVRIYRPITRTDDLDTWKFVVLNDSASPQVFLIMVDIDVVNTMTATAVNMAGSYFVFKLTTDGTVPCVVSNGNTLYVETAKANEVFDSDDGAGLQQLSQ